MNLKKNTIIGITFILLSTTNCFALIDNNKKQIYSSNYIKNYLYGSILHNNNQHNLAVNNLKKTHKLQGSHSDFDIKFITSLTVEGKIDEAAKYVFSLDNVYSDIFIFNFLKSIYFLKHKEYQKALVQLNKIDSSDNLFFELRNVLKFWIEIEKNKYSNKILIKNFRSSNSGITLINKFLASKYINDNELQFLYNQEILNSNDFIRYKILLAWNKAIDNQKDYSLKMVRKR